jgi:hypothetical protein
MKIILINISAIIVGYIMHSVIRKNTVQSTLNSIQSSLMKIEIDINTIKADLQYIITRLKNNTT